MAMIESVTEYEVVRKAIDILSGVESFYLFL